MAVQALKFETIQKIYSETYERLKEAVEVINTSALIEELAKRVSTLSKNKFQMMHFNPEESRSHLAKLSQMHREITLLDRDLQDVDSTAGPEKIPLLQFYLNNVKELSEKIVRLQTKIEELSSILGAYRSTSPQSHVYSLLDGFSPAQSPATSVTLNDWMTTDSAVSTSTRKNSLTKSCSDPLIIISGDRESTHIPVAEPEDSDDDGYVEEIPKRVTTTHLTSHRAKKSISYETGLGNLLTNQDHFDVDSNEFTSYFAEVDAGMTIRIHVDYIQARAILFTNKSPRELSYQALNDQLIMTCAHAGQFLHRVTQMTPVQLQAQSFDPLSLSDTLQRLINALRIMRDGGKRAIEMPKDPLQAKFHGPFIARDCQRIDRVIQRMTEKMEEVLKPMIILIDTNTDLVFPSVIIRLIIDYLNE